MPRLRIPHPERGRRGAPDRRFRRNRVVSRCRRVLVLLVAASALYFVLPATATVGDGWRWARYDSKPVRVHIVADVSVDAWLTNILRTAAKGWEATGDVSFDFPRPVTDCAAVTKQNTVCVSADGAAACGAAMGCFLPGPPIGVGVDGLQLFSYSRAWINGDRGPDGDLQTLCHELGHAIGLGHTEDGPPTGASCMSNAEFSTTPSQADLEFLHALYQVKDVKPRPASKGEKRNPQP